MKHHRTGHLIREYRQKNDMTQQQVADALGLKSLVSICKWETGVIALPQQHWRSLSKLLGIPMEILLNTRKAEDPTTIKKFHEYERRWGIKPYTPDYPAALIVRDEWIKKLKTIQHTYPNASLQNLADALFPWVLDLAYRWGLNGNWEPNLEIKPPGRPKGLSKRNPMLRQGTLKTKPAANG